MKICPRCFSRYDDDAVACSGDRTELLRMQNTTEGSLIGTVAADRYLLLEVLGAGGMGTVYRAYQLAMSRFVAIKVLANPSEKKEVVVERFSREAKSVAQLRSPYTIVVHDFGQLANGDLFLAMELLTGPTLEQVILRDKRVSVARMLYWMDQVCLSLEEAHERGMIHRDIKPRNIIIEDEGTPNERAKVLDFGLVKWVQGMDEEAGRLTRPGVIQGSPAYMAPEMWSPECGPVGRATDIYALGCVMYEMLTGMLIFPTTEVPKFMYQHLFQPPPNLEDPELAPMQAIIHRCLAKKPADRFATIAELRAALAAAAYPPAKPARVWPWLLAAVVVAFSAAGVKQLVDRPEVEVATEPVVASSTVTPPPVRAATIAAEPKLKARPPQPPPKEKKPLEVEIVGAVDRDNATSVVNGLSRALEKCLLKTRRPITVRFFVRPSGTINAVRVTPEDETARACVERAAQGKTFASFPGDFAVVGVAITGE